MADVGAVPPHKKVKQAPCAEIPELPAEKKMLLREAMVVLDDDVAFGFNLLKIIKSNVETCASFSDCFLKFERSVEEPGPADEKDVYNFAGVLVKGLNVLNLYLEDPAKIPEDKAERLALQRLTQTILRSEGLQIYKFYSNCVRA